MRFLSLILSGCALVDASGDAKDGGLGNPALFDRGVVPGGGGATEVRLGQFDGTPDLDVTWLFGSTVTISKNMGAGVFAEPMTTGVTGYQRLAVGELSADGELELVVASDTLLDVYSGNGTGGFDLVKQLGSFALPGPTQVVVGSFPMLESQPSRRGIAIAYSGVNHVRVISDVFEASPVSIMLPLPNEADDVIVANVAGSPGDEVVVSTLGQNQLLEFSIANPPPPATSRTLPNGAQAHVMATGELGSGTAEIDVAYTAISTGPSSLGVRLGSATGLETNGPVFGVNLDSLDVGVGDVDGDGRDDVIALVRTQNGHQLHVFPRSAVDDFSTSIVVALTGSPNHLVVGNLNGDNKADVLVYPNSESGIDVLLSR